MSSTEPARHSLYSRLEDVLGHEHADTLMKYLPNDRADEVATKGDLSRLEASTKADIGRLETSTKADIGRLEASTKSNFEIGWRPDSNGWRIGWTRCSGPTWSRWSAR